MTCKAPNKKPVKSPPFSPQRNAMIITGTIAIDTDPPFGQNLPVKNPDNKSNNIASAEKIATSTKNKTFD